MAIADRAVLAAREMATSPLGESLARASVSFLDEALVMARGALKSAPAGTEAAAAKSAAKEITAQDFGLGGRMPVRMFKVLRDDGRGLYSNFDWESGGYLPQKAGNRWLPGKPISHREIPAETDPSIKPLIEKRAGMGEGLYLAANPGKWQLSSSDRIFEAFLKDREDRLKLRSYFRMSTRVADDYLLNDFNAQGPVMLTRELSAREFLTLKARLAAK